MWISLRSMCLGALERTGALLLHPLPEHGNMIVVRQPEANKGQDRGSMRPATWTTSERHHPNHLSSIDTAQRRARCSNELRGLEYPSSSSARKATSRAAQLQPPGRIIVWMHPGKQRRHVKQP